MIFSLCLRLKSLQAQRTLNYLLLLGVLESSGLQRTTLTISKKLGANYLLVENNVIFGIARSLSIKNVLFLSRPHLVLEMIRSFLLHTKIAYDRQICPEIDLSHFCKFKVTIRKLGIHFFPKEKFYSYYMLLAVGGIICELV